MTRSRLVPGCSRADFVTAAAEVGWTLLEARGGGGDSRSFALMFEASSRTYVSWVELNEMPRMPFVELDGDDPSDELFEEIVEATCALDDSKLLQLPELAQDDEVAALSLFALGVGAPEERDAAFDRLLLEGLRSDAAVVRRGALLGLRYVSWRCGQELLEALASSDDHEENRNLARRVLARY